MPSPSIYLRTPEATPGSFVKILWDFTCSTMGSTHPPQYELLKSRITPSTSKYWAVVHIPPVNSNYDPTEVSFVGKSMPTPQMAVEAAAYEALARLRFAVPYASERGYYYFPSRAAPGEVASFPGGRFERDLVLANLAQYVIAQERLTQRVMGYLQSLADLNPQIAIGRPLRPSQERRVLRLVNPLPPIEEECAPVPETFSQDPVCFPFTL
jgi:hypothetical protein